ncbi:hypothetical protein GIB67_010064 [Kingdonia uniflora]|uniref:RING-type E3 ubiquitin transferase n=1 Tax=Kingdonia uniflora TaxID=39325 RepID=A0A7J7KV80_9MAGN|nr:hypothetical protein GIB67_010064 [Kingdonia uniflora]
MSVTPGRIRIDGNRNFRLYWCYQCHRSVRIASSIPFNIICPRCFGEFLYELETPSPRLPVDFSGLDLSPEARLLEALSLILNPPTRLRNREFDGRFTWELEPQRGAQSGPFPWIILQPVEQNRPPRNVLPQETPISPSVDPRNFFVGPGLNQLIEELTENDRPGPPPAPSSAIEAMPKIKIMPAHLIDGSHCPVCMEEFEVGEEVRQMPCKHVYHSECIVPWLEMHNSCPVCRLGLPNDEVQYDGDVAGRNVGHRRHSRWNQFSSFWPSRWRWRYRSIGSHNDNNNITTSRSRSGK